MDADDGGSGEARSFRLNFSSEGVAKLRDEVTEKLKEFMGEYTDDTLVEYVIVLLRNGRRKDEARNELNVFLDDDSDSFVSWLWDHLASNLSLYVQGQESNAIEVAKSEAITGEPSQLTQQNISHQAESENLNLHKSSRPRHNREWKGLVRDEVERPFVPSSVVDSPHLEKGSHGKVGSEKQSVSPQPVHRKRRRPEEQQQNKREVVSQATINAPRRLLQFAVRDAVATSRASDTIAEPSLKRLRSIVSTSIKDPNIEERSHRAPNSMAAAIRAVAEAAKDVTRVRSSSNVFDRLGRPSDASETLNQLPEFGDTVADDVEDEIYGNITERARLICDEKNDYGRAYTGNMTVLQNDLRMEIDYSSRDEEYDRKIIRQGVEDTFQSGAPGGYRGENSLPVHSRLGKNDMKIIGQGIENAFQSGAPGGYRGENSLAIYSRLGKNAEELVHKSGKNRDLSGAISNTSHKLINASGSSNTWKAPQYQEARDSFEVDNRKLVQVTDTVIPKSGVELMKENNNPIASTNGNAKLEEVLQKESQNVQSSIPGTNPVTGPVEDADSRTIFVNNVHFAATKDSLSRHFNKFGDVLKVIILVDAATGKPKGSAYIEFTKKEAADNALSLDGTSFMSRILKVVRKSSAQPEASSMTWPRIARASPFPVSRYGRTPYPRGVSGAYRSRLPIKPGARSMQWKRDAQPTTAEVPVPASANSLQPSTRSLTYVRTGPKTNGNSGAT